MIGSVEALQRLKDGNRRFLTGKTGWSPEDEQERRERQVGGQAPFAIVLGCSDSRVPPERVFDQGVGDLFVIRVAGNIAVPSLLGSIEYAAETFETPLLIVLGHSQCGAVKATVDEALAPAGELPPNIEAVVECIRPAVRSLLDAEPGVDAGRLLRDAVGVNVRNTMARIKHDSEILSKRIQNGKLKIVGAEYSLETGVVEFLD